MTRRSERLGGAKKAPRQERSRATVEAIIEAAAQVLAEADWDGATTTVVAERAGVSVGTLYQYFPNKAAYVAALAERYIDEMVCRMEDALSQVVDEEPRASLERLVDAAVDAHLVAPRLQQQLIARFPDVGMLDEVSGGGRRLTLMFEAYLRQHAERMGLRDPAFVAFTLQATIEGLAHKTAVERPETLSEPRWRALCREILGACLRADCAGDDAASHEPGVTEGAHDRPRSERSRRSAVSAGAKR